MSSVCRTLSRQVWVESCRWLCNHYEVRKLARMVLFCLAVCAAQPSHSRAKDADAACVYASGDPLLANHKWLQGSVPIGAYLDHRFIAVPVVQTRQSEMMRRAKRGALIRLSFPVAKAAVGKASLNGAQYFYLARVGFFGFELPGTVPPDHALNLSLSVDDHGVAYVTSFRMGNGGRTEMAAVLGSPVPLHRLISICEGAI